MNNLRNDLNDLIDAWQNFPEPSIKISSFFPIYSHLFKHLRGLECTFIETGVLSGGSLFMWRKWLGPKARIIGIDLNPDAKKWEKSGFEIYIGDQGDPNFWKEVLPNIGQVDAFLDDGGHESFQQIVTINELINHIHNNSVLVVEDTFTSFMNDFSSHGTNSFLNFSKDATDILTAQSFSMYPNRFPTEVNTHLIENFKHVFSISFFNGIVAFHINKNLCSQPKILRNMEAKPIKDFRYDGKRSALIDWPNVFKRILIKISGR